MVKLGGLVGALIGFAVSVVFTEVIFPNNLEWQPVIANVALTVLGALSGSALVRRFTKRNAQAT